MIEVESSNLQEQIFNLIRDVLFDLKKLLLAKNLIRVSFQSSTGVTLRSRPSHKIEF